MAKQGQKSQQTFQIYLSALKIIPCRSSSPHSGFSSFRIDRILSGARYRYPRGKKGNVYRHQKTFFFQKSHQQSPIFNEDVNIDTAFKVRFSSNEKLLFQITINMQSHVSNEAKQISITLMLTSFWPQHTIRPARSQHYACYSDKTHSLVRLLCFASQADKQHFQGCQSLKFFTNSFSFIASIRQHHTQVTASKKGLHNMLPTMGCWTNTYRNSIARSLDFTSLSAIF